MNLRYPVEVNMKRNLEELANNIAISPDKNGKAQNVDGKVLSASMMAGIAETFHHNLDRIPTGYILLQANDFVALQFIAKDKKTLTLKSNVSCDVTILVL